MKIYKKSDRLKFKKNKIAVNNLIFVGLIQEIIQYLKQKSNLKSSNYKNIKRYFYK